MLALLRVGRRGRFLGCRMLSDDKLYTSDGEEVQTGAQAASSWNFLTASRGTQAPTRGSPARRRGQSGSDELTPHEARRELRAAQQRLELAQNGSMFRIPLFQSFLPNWTPSEQKQFKREVIDTLEADVLFYTDLLETDPSLWGSRETLRPPSERLQNRGVIGRYIGDYDERSLSQFAKDRLVKGLRTNVAFDRIDLLRSKDFRDRAVRRLPECLFCRSDEWLDFTNPRLLNEFVSGRGRIMPKRITRLCSKHQRKLARTIKTSRKMAIMPYVSQRTGLEELPQASKYDLFPFMNPANQRRPRAAALTGARFSRRL